MLKESISGVRGIVGEGLTPEVIIRYCAAFATFLPQGAIIVARDSRPSGAAISDLLCSSLRLAGRDVVAIGIQSTPTAEIITAISEAAGGIIITASHNPIEWNALKFLKSDGTFLNALEIEKLLELKNDMTERNFGWALHDKIGNLSFLEFAEENHVDAILKLEWLDIEAIRKARFKVVLDSNGGTGSIALMPLLEKLGCEVIPLGCTPNGNFKHNPEPRQENLAELCELVRANHADIGLATDPDADRLALVDENGIAIGEEYTLAIGAAEASKFLDGPIVVNLSTSAMVESLGKQVIRTPVGEINVTSKMLEIGAQVGGEGNGGLIIPSCHPGRDGILATAVILNRMARTGKKLSELTSEFPKLTMIKEKSSLSLDYATVEIRLKEGFENPSTDTSDGVRIITPEGWLHVRASNTEPIMRFIAESENEEKARNLIEKAKKLLAQ
jgi:phosphomannomutase